MLSQSPRLKTLSQMTEEIEQEGAENEDEAIVVEVEEDPVEETTVQVETVVEDSNGVITETTTTTTATGENDDEVDAVGELVEDVLAENEDATDAIVNGNGHSTVIVEERKTSEPFETGNHSGGATRFDLPMKSKSPKVSRIRCLVSFLPLDGKLTVTARLLRRSSRRRKFEPF